MKTVVRSLGLVVLLCFVLLGCQSNSRIKISESVDPTPDHPTETSLPATFTELPPATHTTAAASPTSRPYQPVIVISMDGAQAAMVNSWRAEGIMPAFNALAERGWEAAYLRTVDPSLTVPAQTSLSSGALPQVTGMVSNEYHAAVDDFYWYRRGFEEPFDGGEPLWVTASRQGYTTAALFFPGGSPAVPGQLADYTIGYGVELAYSRQEELSLAPAGQWEGLPHSFSPPLEAEYLIPEVGRIYLLAVDLSDDGYENYEAVYFSRSRSLDPGTQPVRRGEWAPVVIKPATYAGAWFTVQVLAPPIVTIYHTGVYQNTAAPRGLLDDLNQRFNFFPAGADIYALQHGWITEADYLLLLERNARWISEVTAWVLETYQPDLTFTWQEALDTAGHAFYLVDPLQPDYSSMHVQACESYYRLAAQVADQALETMLRAVDLENATVFVVSDHGMAPVHTSVYINTILEQAGLLVLDEKNYVVVEESQAFAIASGGAVHIYINLQGRERAGIVRPENYPEIQMKIRDELVGLVNPQTGEQVFQRVLLRTELNVLGIDHPHSGDVFAQVNPGYTIDDWRGWDRVFAPARQYGQHGYDSSLPSMQGIFLVSGARLDGHGEILPPVNLVDIVPTIAAWLKIDTPPSVVGQPIQGFVSP